MTAPEPAVALSWSGGKDSALALQALRDAGTAPVALLTTFTEDHNRVSMHAVRRRAGASPGRGHRHPAGRGGHPAACPNEVYEERMDRALRTPPLDQAVAMAFADLPASVDPCGENGEFHTFVHAGPIFGHPIEIAFGEAVMREGFAFQDLMPGHSSAVPQGSPTLPR